LIGYLEHGSIKGHKHVTKIGVKIKLTLIISSVYLLFDYAFAEEKYIAAAIHIINNKSSEMSRST
jgi:hypothetical protein